MIDIINFIISVNIFVWWLQGTVHNCIQKIEERCNKTKFYKLVNKEAKYIKISLLLLYILLFFTQSSFFINCIYGIMLLINTIEIMINTSIFKIKYIQNLIGFWLGMYLLYFKFIFNDKYDVFDKVLTITISLCLAIY